MLGIKFLNDLEGSDSLISSRDSRDINFLFYFFYMMNHRFLFIMYLTLLYFNILFLKNMNVIERFIS